MKVVYITPSSFRTVNAGALRNANLSIALADGGHDVLIVSGDAPEDSPAEEYASLLPTGVKIVAGGRPRSGAVHRLLRLVLSTTVTARSLSREDIVLLYNPGPIQYFIVRRAARRSGAMLILDVTEWLGVADHPGRWLSPYSWLYTVFMFVLPHLLGKNGAAIAISSPMARHLSRRGAHVLVVPPLSDAGRYATARKGDAVRIVVSGSGIARGRKDSTALSLLLSLGTSSARVLDGIQFELLGTPDGETARRLRELDSAIDVRSRGWLGWRDAIELLSGADWLLLIRDPSKRRNRLGMPSKVMEALSIGVPVVTNRCGGLTDYLADGANSLIAPGTSPADLAVALDRARHMPLAPAPDLRFAPAAWSDPLRRFLSEQRDGTQIESEETHGEEQ